MSVCSDELLTLSRGLLQEGQGEAELRASIGRGYYALYHEAQLTADRLSLPSASSRLGVHESLIERFQSQGKRLGYIARQMRGCKLTRVKADYYIEEDISQKEAKAHILKCQQLMDELRRISQGGD
jgi:uncharacterized protein (UPF0332 family)